MTASRPKKNGSRIGVRNTRWLAALERELKSRVGWVDEAVSPFATRMRNKPVPARIERDVFRSDKAA
jgi:hypothetical protein